VSERIKCQSFTKVTAHFFFYVYVSSRCPLRCDSAKWYGTMTFRRTFLPPSSGSYCLCCRCVMLGWTTGAAPFILKLVVTCSVVATYSHGLGFVRNHRHYSQTKQNNECLALEDCRNVVYNKYTSAVDSVRYNIGDQNVWIVLDMLLILRWHLKAGHDPHLPLRVSCYLLIRALNWFGYRSLLSASVELKDNSLEVFVPPDRNPTSSGHSAWRSQDFMALWRYQQGRRCSLCLDWMKILLSGWADFSAGTKSRRCTQWMKFITWTMWVRHLFRSAHV